MLSTALFRAVLPMICSCIHSRREQVRDAHAAEHFRADAVGYAVDDFRAVLRWIDMGAERPLAEGRIDHLDDRFGDGPCIGVGGLKRGETLHRQIRQPCIRSVIILRGARRIGRQTGMRKVVGALGKGPGTMIEVSMPQRVSSPA